jgi:uncharacterized protein (DUF885 family)
MKRPWVALVSVLLALSFASSWQQPLAATPAPSWDGFVSHFIEAYFVAHPSFAVNAGRHEFDGKLPDWSPAALSQEADRLHSARKQALDFNPTSLDERQRFERDYLVSVIDRDLFWLKAAQWPYKNPMFYSTALDPNVYVTREYAPLKERLRAYIAYAKAIPLAVKQIQGNLRTPLPRAYIEIGKTVFGGLASYYEQEVPPQFASVKEAELQRELQVANAQAAKAMKGLVGWLDAQQAQATDDFALGAELFRRMLREAERVDIPLERLEQVGRQDLDRNLTALREACNAYRPGKTMAECIAREQAAKPEGGSVVAARQQLPSLKAFILAKGLVSIPGTEEAQVAESPPYRRWNLAYIDIPGPFDQGLPSIYYVAPPDPTWSKAEREAYIPSQADLLLITVHEVWPGHFLQFQHAKRLPSRLGQVFHTYTFTEGWAHYAEEMMWEAGLGQGDPETHIGQLRMALLRDIRFLSAIGLHTQGMTVKASEQMFRELAYQDPGNARQQAARGTFDPAYLSYTLGKLMIRKLREDWTTPHGGRQAWRAFHDKLLSYGGPPVPLVRRAMLGDKVGPPL